MSMNEGWCDVTLAAGTGTGTWKHPAQIEMGNSAAKQVELDSAPQFYSAVITAFTAGLVGIQKFAFTKSGVTVTSTHVGDTSTVRVIAKVRELPQNWEA